MHEGPTLTQDTQENGIGSIHDDAQVSDFEYDFHGNDENANMTHPFDDLNTSQAAPEPQENFTPTQPMSSASSGPITSVQTRASRAAPMRQQARYAEAASPAWQSENEKRCKRNKRVADEQFKRIFAWQGPNTSQCREISPKISPSFTPGPR